MEIMICFAAFVMVILAINNYCLRRDFKIIEKRNTVLEDENHKFRCKIKVLEDLIQLNEEYLRMIRK